MQPVEQRGELGQERRTTARGKVHKRRIGNNPVEVITPLSTRICMAFDEEGLWYRHDSAGG